MSSALVPSGAQTINAASCNATDVQSALNSVTSTTTTVTIPAGTCTWTTRVSLTVPSGSTKLSILGAGSQNTTGGGDATVIVDNDATDSQLLSITTAAASSYFRLAGLTFQGGNGGVKYAVVGVGGFSQKVRVDHNHFNSTTYNPSVNPSLLLISNWTYGVVDHNLFDMAAATQGVWTWEDAYNNDSFGDGSWADVTGLGSANFVFIENNIFNGELYANDCTRAGRQVFRFNTLNGNELQTHPTGGSGRVRGCRAFEVYQNTFVASNSNPVFNAFFLSSGTGVILGERGANRI